MSKIKLFAILGVLALIGTVWFQQKQIQNIKAERDRFEENNNAILSEMKQWQIDSTTMATDVKTLRFTIDELERYRAKDMVEIEQMGVKIRDLESIAKHNIDIDAPISVPIKDGITIIDSIPIISKIVKMTTPHISIDAMILRDTLIGTIHLPVTIRQAVWVEYKRKCIFWKRPTGVHQTITSDNPYVKINYSEYINIQK